MGYDSHRFVAGRPLTLGGVRLDYDKGLAGHSDADALLHAVTDAVLGALGAGDIGEHFPDTDPQHENADSTGFLTAAVRLAAERGWRVVNCDATVLAEAPRLGPHKQAIRSRLAKLLDLGERDVSVKAKTGEGMGPVGRGEGIVCMAVVLLAAGTGDT